MYFNLKSECYFVRGKTQSAIYNLDNGEIIHLDKEETQIMQSILNGEECAEDNFLQELAELGWGFFSQERFFIDKLRPYSNYMLLRPDLRPPTLNIAFLQLTPECRHSYEHCKKMFCTPCRTSLDCKQVLKISHWKQIIEYLCLAGVSKLILTGGDVTLYEELDELIAFMLQKDLRFSIVVNTSSAFTSDFNGKIPQNIPLIAYVCDVEETQFLKDKLAPYENFTMLYNERVNDKELPQNLKGNVSRIRVYDLKITKKSLRRCYLGNYFFRKDFNDCLNSKIYIDYQGNVVPCFQNNELHIGNLLKEEFPKVYGKLIKNYWNKPIAHEKCGGCEWYYGCPVCMYMEPEKDCFYDVEKAVWK